MNIALRIVVSAGISLIVLALMFKLGNDDPGGISRARIMNLLMSVSPVLLTGYFGCTLIQSFLRTVRYRILLVAGGVDVPLPMPQMFMITLTRNMLVDLLPARAGELGYVAVMTAKMNVRPSDALSSLALSMFLDFAALLSLLCGVAGLLLFSGQAPGWLARAFAGSAIITVVFGIIVFAGIERTAALAERLFPHLAKKQPFSRLFELAHVMAAAIRAASSWRVLAYALLLSFGVRIFKYTGIYLVFLAVTLRSLPELAAAHPAKVILALVGAEASAALPVPSFMSFGTYELGGALALTSLGFPAAASKLTMFVVHICSQALDYFMGACGMVSLLWTGSAAGVRQPNRDRRRSAVAIVGAASLLVVGAGLLARQLYATRKIGTLVPPGAGANQTMAKIDAAKLKSAVSGLKGTMYWSSNRFGNHEILALSLPELELRRLTDHPNADYYARVSPDGKKLAFCRSQIEWVSQRDVIAWDLLLMDLKSGATAVVAANSIAPSWSSDGRFLYYQRQGTEVMEYTLATGSHRLLFKSGLAPIPDKCTINQPAYNPDTGQLAAAFRGSLGVITLFSASGESTAIGDGCETGWSPDYSFIYHVKDGGGNKKNSIRKYDPKTKRSSLWLDVPGEWSHEYFPKLSRDGNYLVFGASTGGHEHDSADYEIFLWKVDSPDTDVTRVTFHSGNDNWPDIWLEH
jgi:hypothetical protein